MKRPRNRRALKALLLEDLAITATTMGSWDICQEQTEQLGLDEGDLRVVMFEISDELSRRAARLPATPELSRTGPD